MSIFEAVVPKSVSTPPSRPAVTSVSLRQLEGPAPELSLRPTPGLPPAPCFSLEAADFPVVLGALESEGRPGALRAGSLRAGVLFASCICTAPLSSWTSVTRPSSFVALAFPMAPPFNLVLEFSVLSPQFSPPPAVCCPCKADVLSFTL